MTFRRLSKLFAPLALWKKQHNKARRKVSLFKRHGALLVTSGLVILRVRLTLTFASYRTVLGMIEKTKIVTSLEKRKDPKVLVWAVEHSSKLVPSASCLTKALALRWLLARAGQDCTIRIGVNKPEGQAVKAHAWVIHEDEILIGGRNSEHISFVPIVDL